MTVRVLFLIAGFGLSLGAVGLGAHAEDASLLVVTIVGQAEVRKSPEADWGPARLRAAIAPGGAARTSAGRLSLRTAGGQTLRMDRGSAIEFVPADHAARVRLGEGSVWAAVAPLSPPGAHLSVETGPVVVSVREGGVGIAFASDGSVVIRVYHGSAECTGTSPDRPWSRALTDGQELSVSAAAQLGATSTFDRSTLEPWAIWNEDQDLAGGYRRVPAAH